MRRRALARCKANLCSKYPLVHDFGRVAQMGADLEGSGHSTPFEVELRSPYNLDSLHQNS